MVKITISLLKQRSSKHLFSANFITKIDFLKKVTHLYLQEQEVKTIENLDQCVSLLFLYLYDNQIRSINNLHHLHHLSALYLQNNYIEKIENLECLINLTYLNLSRNRISVVEGMGGLINLKQLWLENQYLRSDHHLVFETSSIKSISLSLEVLNVSGNRVQCIRELKHLRKLDKFYAENNQLVSLEVLVNTVSHWKFLRLLKLGGNPVCQVRNYKDNVVVNCEQLEELDGKDIKQSYKDFLLNWRECENKKRETVQLNLLRPKMFDETKYERDPAM